MFFSLFINVIKCTYDFHKFTTLASNTDVCALPESSLNLLVVLGGFWAVYVKLSLESCEIVEVSKRAESFELKSYTNQCT